MACVVTDMKTIATAPSKNINVLLLAFFAMCAGSGYFFLPALSIHAVHQPWCAFLTWVVAGVLLQSPAFVALLISSGSFALLLASAHANSSGIVDALLQIPEVTTTDWSNLPFFIRLFFFMFLPCIFFFGHLQFYDLPNELRRLRIPPVLRAAILFVGSVAAFRSRFSKRAEIVMECLHARGVETRGWHRRAATLPIWMIPLVRSCLIEGSERRILLEILRVRPSAILNYSPPSRLILLSSGQRVAIVVASILLIGRIAVWICT